VTKGSIARVTAMRAPTTSAPTGSHANLSVAPAGVEAVTKARSTSPSAGYKPPCVQRGSTTLHCGGPHDAHLLVPFIPHVEGVRRGLRDPGAISVSRPPRRRRFMCPASGRGGLRNRRRTRVYTAFPQRKMSYPPAIQSMFRRLRATVQSAPNRSAEPHGLYVRHRWRRAMRVSAACAGQLADAGPYVKSRRVQLFGARPQIYDGGLRPGNRTTRAVRRLAPPARSAEPA
jgi:hypothetical protein